MTAVEWLTKEIETLITIETFQKWKAIKEQAKEMEKQMIIDAHLIGLIHSLEIEATKQAEQYYNETYGK